MVRRRISADREKDFLKLLGYLLNLPCLSFVFSNDAIERGLGLGTSLSNSNTAVETIAAECESR